MSAERPSLLRRLIDWLLGLFGASDSPPEEEDRPPHTDCPQCGKQASLIPFEGYELYTCPDCGCAHGLEKVIEATYGLEDYIQYLDEEIEYQLEEQEAVFVPARVEGVRSIKLGAAIDLRFDDEWPYAEDDSQNLLIASTASSSGLEFADTALGYVLETPPGKAVVTVDEARADGLREGQNVQVASAEGHAIHPARQRKILRRFRRASSVYDKEGRISLDDLLDPNRLPRIPEGKKPQGGRLNDSQREAIAKTLALPEGGMFLIQGPPGTGKTTVIHELVRRLLEKNQSVWVTAHTKIAVQNLLEKAVDDDGIRQKGILRVPQRNDAIDAKIDAEGVQEKAKIRAMAAARRDDAELSGDPFELGRYAPMLTTCTLDSAAARLMKAPEFPPGGAFDYAIIDEASMNLLPKVAIAAACSKRVVLVGDHRQLQSVVNAPSYEDKLDFQRSLFEIIQGQRDDLMVMLDTQYRSVPGLMDWASQLMYNGDLEDGRDDAHPGIQIAGDDLESPVLWLDVSKEQEGGHTYTRQTYRNPSHARLLADLIEEILGTNDGLSITDVGVITPYNGQKRQIRETWSKRSKASQKDSFDVGTVDSFQGREYRIVIYDLTTTEPKRSHSNPMRLNVGLSRAKDLIIVFGGRDFARDPSANPFFWSLGKNPQTQVRDLSEVVRG